MKAIVSLITAAICLFSSFTGLYEKQIETIGSITEVEDRFFIMDYTYDYDIDEMMKRGIWTHVDLFAYGIMNVFGDANNFGCTTFNSVTPSGDYLLSRNFDYMDAPCMLVWTHPENGYASISTVSLYFFAYSDKFVPGNDITGALTLLAPYAPLDGINEKGLSVGILEIETAPVFQLTTRPDLTTTTMVRAVLDKAATVDEAIEIFRSYDMRDFSLEKCSYHYQLADAYGNTAVIEYAGGKMNVLYPESKKSNAVDYMAATNFVLTEGVDDPDGMGYERYDTVFEALDKTGGMTTQKQAMNILSLVSMKDADLHGYICSTLWSAVFNTNKKTVDFCHTQGYDKVYSFSVDKPLEYTIK